MNHWMWPVSLVGILSTAVVCGTDMFFLTIGRPALRLASPSAGDRNHGFFPHVRRRTDADLGRLGDLVQLLAGRVKQEWTAPVLFRIALNADSVRRYLRSLVKTYQSASNRSGKNRRKPQQWSRATGVVGQIGNDPGSAARCVPACPVPRVVSCLGVNVAGALPLEESAAFRRWVSTSRRLERDERTGATC